MRTRFAYPSRVNRASTMTNRQRRGSVRFLVLVVMGVLIAHDAIYAAQHGLGSARDDALAAIAHQYWTGFAALTILGVAVATAAAVAGLMRLSRALRGLAAVPSAVGATGYGSELVHLWPRLFLAVTLAFLLQENAEHLAAGQPPPGLWALSGPHYPLAIPVLAVVTGLLAAAGAWFRWRGDVLAGRLHAARAAAAFGRLAPRRAPAGRWGLVAALVAHRWILLRLDAGRAPPAGSTP